jgi:hypothetical protein
MARDYGRIGTGIWAESSIKSLSPAEQRAYLLLLTQPELSRCGVLPYTLRRWARLGAGDTPTKFRAALRGLEEGRHIVIDEDAEELLVRTYVRHDGLLTQPQVVAAMVKDFRTIRSDRVRLAFLTEVRRLWTLPLDEKERRGLRIAVGVVENDKQRESVGAGLGPAFRAALDAGFLEPFPEGCLAGLPAPFAKALARPSGPGPGPGPITRPSDEVTPRSDEVDQATDRTRAAS